MLAETRSAAQSSFPPLRSHMAGPLLQNVWEPPTDPDTRTEEIEQFRKQIIAYIQIRKLTGERYNENRFAKAAGLKQQTLNDLLRGKTTRITKKTRTKITDFMENNPLQPVGADGPKSAATLPMFGRNVQQQVAPNAVPACVLPPISHLLDYAQLPRP